MLWRDKGKLALWVTSQGVEIVAIGEMRDKRHGYMDCLFCSVLALLALCLFLVGEQFFEAEAIF